MPPIIGIFFLIVGLFGRCVPSCMTRYTEHKPEGESIRLRNNMILVDGESDFLKDADLPNEIKSRILIRGGDEEARALVPSINPSANNLTLVRAGTMVRVLEEFTVSYHLTWREPHSGYVIELPDGRKAVTHDLTALKYSDVPDNSARYFLERMADRNYDRGTAKVRLRFTSTYVKGQVTHDGTKRNVTMTPKSVPTWESLIKEFKRMTRSFRITVVASHPEDRTLEVEADKEGILILFTSTKELELDGEYLEKANLPPPGWK